MATIQDEPRVTPKGRPASESAGSVSTRIRPHVITAVFRRNVASYFSNPAGYVFITLFVFVSAWAAFWHPSFFTSNLANLDTLNNWMPYLLLLFIPAITMTAWAEERRLGTDELLLTLPARDVEVVLGKYFAALGIYTIALLFSLSHVLILMILGSPDPGLMVSTYLGYWFMGAMLISVGLVASMLSSNVTVAFILAGLFCAIPVFAGMIGASFGMTVRRIFENNLSVPEQFRDFGTGVVPLSSVVYFVSLTAGMLYLNMILLGRRHWAGGARSAGLGLHSAMRVVAVGITLVAVTVLVSRLGIRFDLTAEGLHTLSQESKDVIRQIPDDKPVFVQAYFSPEVPREYVQTKKDLIDRLRDYEARSGGKIRLNLVETEIPSEEARDAEKRFGIAPRTLMSAENARATRSDVILGVAFTSGLEEVVVPFFDRGLPIEYELTRSLRVVSKPKRKRVGILNTDAKLLGGMDFRSMSQDAEWPIVTELKKQYDVTSVSADTEIPLEFDCLLVAQPSGMSQPQIDNLTAYIRKGRPALLFLDPLPAIDPTISPDEPRQPPGGMFGGGPPPEPKGNIRPLLDLLGIDWPSSQIVWNYYNPHPQLELDPEVVFIGKGSGASDAFNSEELVSSGLQEIVTLFPGLIRNRPGSRTDIVPLLRTNDAGGTLPWSQVIQKGFMGIGGLNRNRPHLRSGMPYTIAARIEGDLPVDDAGAGKSATPVKANAIVIADLDMISQQFFDLRRQGNDNLNFDNVTFVLNCVDVLSGDDASTFVRLRNRRPRHRTLEWMERQTKVAVEEAQAEIKLAEQEADEQLQKAQQRLDEKVAKIREDKEIDARTKEIMMDNVQQVENRRFTVEKENIDDQKKAKLRDIADRQEQQTRAVQNQTRSMAIILPPLLPAFLGMIVFAVRTNRENRGANPNRLA